MIDNKWIGYIIRRRKISDPPGILEEIWNDVGGVDNSKTPNQWKLISSKWQVDKSPRKKWVTFQEYMKATDEEKKNLMIKSKPTTGPLFLNEKKEICFTMTDEHDHMYTVRMDNPSNLDLEEANLMMGKIEADIKKEIEKDKENETNQA